MVLYKMVARDVNSNPTQYRTWIVADNPDLTAQYYYGLKSGNNALVDISAYAINDPNALVGFDLPLGASWNPIPQSVIQDFPILKVLPFTCEDSSFAIIDGYAYMFGGNITSHIYRAEINNPADWIDTGATLPTPLYGSSLAIVDGYIYLFGGNNGQMDTFDGAATNTIFVAPVSNPLSWSDTGAHLPRKVQYSNLGMNDGYLYLFGGREVGASSTAILTALTSSPTIWTDTGQHLPTPIYGSCFAQINNNWMLFGGNITPDTPSAGIWSAPVATPTVWSFDGYLPYETSFSQFVTIGGDGYIIGPMNGQTPFTGFTPIIQCHLNMPSVWFDTNQYVRGQISHSQVAMIYDRIWLYGGSGETAVFACNQQLKFNYTSLLVQVYGNITRSVFPSTDNLDNPYQALCMPYWKTDYSMSPPPTPPHVPPPPPPPLLPFPPKVPVPPYV